VHLDGPDPVYQLLNEGARISCNKMHLVPRAIPKSLKAAPPFAGKQLQGCFMKKRFLNLSTLVCGGILFLVQPLGAATPELPATPGTRYGLRPAVLGAPIVDASEAPAAQVGEAQAALRKAENGTSSEDLPGRFLASGEFLLWWVKGGPLPVPLVTAGTATDLNPGALGQPGTTVLFGGKNVDYGVFPGGRFAGAYWFGADQTAGLEGAFFFLGQRSTTFRVASDSGGSPVLARPMIDAQTGEQAANLFAFPQGFAGGIAVSSSSELWGAEVNAVGNLVRRNGVSVDMLAGFRYLNLEEDLLINESATLLPFGMAGFNGVTVLPPATMGVMDRFAADNQFYGAQIGARARLRWGRLVADLLGKVAVGSTHEAVTINGTSSLTGPAGTTTTVAGGILALPTDSGRHTQNDFSVVPEGGITLAYQLTRHLYTSVNYTFLYWSDVVRPGNQIDRTVNSSLVPTSNNFGGPSFPPRPGFSFHESSFWAQGIGFGLEFRH
jgi:hypothetical protein